MAKVHSIFKCELLVCFLVTTATLVGCGRSSSLQVATVGSSSMEPTLAGPKYLAQCPNCHEQLAYSVELVDRANRVRCHRCDGVVEIGDKSDVQAGQVVMVQPLQSTDSICRGDLVLFNEQAPVAWESRSIKRLVGFPGERIEIDDGDLLVNGVRYQKKAFDCWSSCIHVDYWDEAVKKLLESSLAPVECWYESTSLWPRTGENAMRHPSPILDELESNPDEPYPYVPVKDIGIIFDLDLESTPDFEMSIRIWCSGAHRTVIWSKANNKFQFHVGSHSPEYLKATIDLSSEASDIASTRVQCLVGCVDNRMIASFVDKEGRLARGWEWELYDCLDIRATKQVEHDSLVHPISVRLAVPSNGIQKDVLGPRFRRIEIVRDIHYRGPQGEMKYELPLVDGYRVLGDNTSVSSDSRTTLSDGISRGQITGRALLRSPFRAIE